MVSKGNENVRLQRTKLAKEYIIYIGNRTGSNNTENSYKILKKYIENFYKEWKFLKQDTCKAQAYVKTKLEYIEGKCIISISTAKNLEELLNQITMKNQIRTCTVRRNSKYL